MDRYQFIVNIGLYFVCGMGGFMNYFIDFKQFRQEYQELIGQGKTYEETMEILTELYGKKKDGEDEDEI